MSAVGRRTEFVVVGELMTDVVASLPGPLREGTDTPADVLVVGGGAGANTAAWLAHDGNPTTFVARLGDDLLGRAARTELESVGVTCRVAVDRTRPTGTCVVLVGADGERTMIPDTGANAGLTPHDLPDELFAAGRHLHVSGYTLMVDGSRMAGLAALDSARLRGMTRSVDVASAGPLADTGVERFLGWVSGVDVLFANESEAAFLAGLPVPSPDADLADCLDAATEAADVLAPHVGTVVIKLGARGACARGPDGAVVHAPGIAVDVVDTTGAGDAFAAGFLSGWCARVGDREALDLGNRSAVRVVARMGARP
jgi:sugar/nucleoside kinase (ribokinase family)